MRRTPFVVASVTALAGVGLVTARADLLHSTSDAASMRSGGAITSAPKLASRFHDGHRASPEGGTHTAVVTSIVLPATNPPAPHTSRAASVPAPTPPPTATDAPVASPPPVSDPPAAVATPEPTPAPAPAAPEPQPAPAQPDPGLLPTIPLPTVTLPQL